MRGAGLLGEAAFLNGDSEWRREDLSSNAHCSLRDAEFLSKTLFDAQQSVGCNWRRDDVNAHRGMIRSESPGATDALVESCWVPWQIEMNHHGRALQVQSFAQ